MTLNKNNIKILLLIICFTFVISSNGKKKSFKELIDIYLGKLDINNAYLSYSQYISLLNNLQKDYPNYFELSSIGKTYEGNEMPLIIMKSPFTQNGDKNKTKPNNDMNFGTNNTNTNGNQTHIIDNSLYNKSGILFTGMHHGREPVSMMMNIYLILHLLSLPRTYLHLFLSSTNIYFIPIINIDTYKYNSKKYLKGTPIRNVMSRKNRRPHSSNNCNIDDIGVDLNRNYDYFFAKDNIGSSGKPCQEDYRGEAPFSEPETINIKNFVESHPNIRIAYNYHSWGNLYITPFNYIKEKESEEIIKKDFPVHYKMYEDFKNEGNFPKNFLFGNADKTIQYLTNGDATDWFLGKRKILSFSPELGNGNKNSDVFYPDKTITFDVLDKNLYGGLYAIQKSMYFLKGELISANYNLCQNKNKYSFNDIYFNRGRLYQNSNLKEYDVRNCYSDELSLNIKVKITNKGFGDYSPGIEFPYIQYNDSNKGDSNTNKKYFYFLAFDLKVDLEKVRSICFWTTIQTLFSVETNGKEEINQTKKDVEVTHYIGKVRCVNINKESDIDDIKIFIDNEIKSMEFIILNIQMTVKKDKFLQKLNKVRKLDINDSQINNTNIYNDEEIIKIYTKNERTIKSEKINGEKIEWKFNSPSIGIKMSDFIENKSFKNKNNNSKRVNPYKILIIVICISLLMIFLIFRIIKNINGRNFQELLVESMNAQRNDNNISINMGSNNEQIVNNLENANQNQNINNEPVHPVQIPRDENERSNSNSDSPNELNI